MNTEKWYENYTKRSKDIIIDPVEMLREFAEDVCEEQRAICTKTLNKSDLQPYFDIMPEL